MPLTLTFPQRGGKGFCACLQKMEWLLGWRKVRKGGALHRRCCDTIRVGSVMNGFEKGRKDEFSGV